MCCVLSFNDAAKIINIYMMCREVERNKMWSRCWFVAGIIYYTDEEDGRFTLQVLRVLTLVRASFLSIAANWSAPCWHIKRRLIKTWSFSLLVIQSHFRWLVENWDKAFFKLLNITCPWKFSCWQLPVVFKREIFKRVLRMSVNKKCPWVSFCDILFLEVFDVWRWEAKDQVIR